MNLFKIITPIFLVILVLSGCAGKSLDDPRVTVIDRSLNRKITLTKLSSAVNPGGLIEVQVTGENDTGYYKNLEYKIEWLDQNGHVIQTIMSRWTSFPVYENAEFRFKAVAPKKSASDFRILIRRKG